MSDKNFLTFADEIKILNNTLHAKDMDLDR